MKTWFTSDYHLGHENIIKYCNRPFKDVTEMNTHLMLNHNTRVKDEDIVYYLGDFCFRNSPGGKEGEGSIHKAEYYKKQLNGHIIFIKGNHDRNNSLKTNIEKIIIRYGGHQICMVHNPIHVDAHYELNFVGHVHEKWKFKRIRQQNDFTDCVNVGVDVWKFMPVSFEEIMKEYKHWKRHQNLNSKPSGSPSLQTSQSLASESDASDSIKT